VQDVSISLRAQSAQTTASWGYSLRFLKRGEEKKQKKKKI